MKQGPTGSFLILSSSSQVPWDGLAFHSPNKTHSSTINPSNHDWVLPHQRSHRENWSTRSPMILHVLLTSLLVSTWLQPRELLRAPVQSFLDRARPGLGVCTTQAWQLRSHFQTLASMVGHEQGFREHLLHVQLRRLLEQGHR